ncbi:putative alpha-tubulin polyglutamylase Ttll1 [Diplonema papillatum]|nr:putative alpha-tubulin polyglutamylase Ttll1 [Diplonema papillatum]
MNMRRNRYQQRRVPIHGNTGNHFMRGVCAGFLFCLVLLPLFALLYRVGFSEEDHPRAAPDAARTYSAACAARTADRLAGGTVPKTVSYLASEFAPERYIKESFSALGYADITPQHREATFVIGKKTAEAIGWRVCAGVAKHNHIKGQIFMVAKHNLASSLRKADAAGALARETGIKSSEGFHQKSFELWQDGGCADFLKDWDEHVDWSAAGPQYILKAITGGHNGAGLTLLDPAKLLAFKRRHDETGRCAAEKILAQRFLRDPFLLHGRTFSMRQFLLVLRVKPLLAVFYEGYVRVTRRRFAPNSTDLRDFVSNSEKVWLSSPTAPLEDRHFWTLRDLASYVRDPSSSHGGDRVSFEGSLRPKIKAIFAHILRSIESNLSPSPSFFGVYGVDMSLDSQLSPWVFEVNFSPELSKFLPLQLIENMYPDVIKMQMRLLDEPQATWADLQQVATDPERFELVADQQQGFTAVYPTG